MRASTPEPSPTRAMEEVKRQEAEETAKAVSPGKKSNDENEEGEVEDVIMKDS